MKYWLKTYNHLIPTKHKFDSMDELKTTLHKIIQISDLKKKSELLENAKNLLEKSEITEEDYKIRKVKILSWKGYREKELAGNEEKPGSIVIISLNDHVDAQDKMFKIYTNGIK